jgi:hypothetical protein
MPSPAAARSPAARAARLVPDAASQKRHYSRRGAKTTFETPIRWRLTSSALDEPRPVELQLASTGYGNAYHHMGTSRRGFLPQRIPPRSMLHRTHCTGSLPAFQLGMRQARWQPARVQDARLIWLGEFQVSCLSTSQSVAVCESPEPLRGFLDGSIPIDGGCG